MSHHKKKHKRHHGTSIAIMGIRDKSSSFLVDHSDDEDSRKHHRSTTIEEPAIDPSFDWLVRRDYLTETFLSNNLMFKSVKFFQPNLFWSFRLSSSPADIEDFWKFVKKYQLFQQRRKPAPVQPADADQSRSTILNLPLIYEKKYRFNAGITISKSISHAEPRYDMTGERIVEYHRLSPTRLAEFKSIIEYYFDFNQKEKVKAKNSLDESFIFISHSSNEFTNFDKIKVIFPLLIIVEKFSNN